MQAINDISERHAVVIDLNFKKVTTLPDIETVSQLACEVWHPHYMPIIGVEQIEYMPTLYLDIK